MTFSNPKQIVLLVVFWAIALFAVDRIANPRSIGQPVR